MGERTKREVLQDFPDSTSAHGLTNIKHADYTVLRLVWIVAVLAAWTACGVHVVDSVRLFRKYKTSVSIQIESSPSMVKFPAVSICNLNLMRKSFLGDQGLGDVLEEISEAERKEDDKDWDALEEEEDETTMQLTQDDALKALLSSTIYTNRLNISRIGHQISEMLLECTFQGRQCYPYNFTQWQHATYGNCYTIIFSEVNYAPFVGSRYGFSITLDTQSDQYVNMVSPAIGFRVHIHPKQYVPHPEDLGFSIAPNVETSVAITQTLISRKPLPYDNTDCHDSVTNDMKRDHIFAFFNKVVERGYVEELNYTLQTCLKDCYVREVMHHCNCTDSAGVTFEQMQGINDTAKNKSHTEACDMRNQIQFTCVQNAIKMITDSQDCDKMCAQPCIHQVYTPRVTSSLWPSEEYLKIKAANWKLRQTTLKDKDMDSVKLAKMLVYFEELNYEAITESAAYSINGLLSDIGGVLGLYAGMSFLTVLEFIELCVRWGKAKRQPVAPPTSATPANDFYVKE